MLNSKYFLVMMALTFAALTAGVTFAVLEMNTYELFPTLKERFFPTAAAAAPAAPAAPAADVQ